MPKLTKKRGAALFALALLLTVVVGFAPYVRSRVQERAAAYGAQVEVDWVLPAFDGVSLRGVRVRFSEAPGVAVELTRVRVHLGTPRRLEVTGGRIQLDGELDDLAAQLGRIKRPEGAASSTPSTELSLSGVALQLRAPPFEVLATNCEVSRGDNGFLLKAERLTGTAPGVSASLEGLELSPVRTDDGFRLARLAAGATSVELGNQIPLGTAAAPANQPGGAGKGKLEAIRRLLETFDRRAGEVLLPNAVVELKGVRVAAQRAGEMISLGPATVRLVREEGRLSLAYEATRGVEILPALKVALRLPLPEEPLVIRVDGGPISLAGLGLHDGDFSLKDTDLAEFTMHGRMEVDQGSEVAQFDGEVSLVGVGLSLDAISRDPLRNLRASFRGKVRAALDASQLSLTGGEFEFGTLRITSDLEVQRLPATKTGDPDRYKIKAQYEVPLVPCQALVDAAPDGLLELTKSMRMAGSFSLKGAAKIDTERLDQDFDLHYDLSSSCRVTDAPPKVEIARFRAPFQIEVIGREGEKEAEFETGPGSGNWTPLSSINPFVQLAVVTCEDGRFMRHEGFDHEAIRNSIRENIRRRKFYRGASTISMQLAKNLYLSREKRLRRKLEELFLTLYLEQALTKEQILELYLNVVEFGPKVYGIGAAARHYFQTSPARLTLSQAFFLGSILPSPRTEHFAAQGALSGGWLRNLRTLMRYANKRQRLSDEDLQRGLSEIPVRGSPAPMRDPDAAAPPEDTGPAELEIGEP